MINEQEIRNLFYKLQNIQAGTTSGGKAGSQVWVKLPQGRVRATCIKDIGDGECVILKADDGQWYVTQASMVSREERSRRQISYRKCEQKSKKEKPYPIISLIQQYETPSEFKDFESWLTGGGKYKLKRVTTEPEFGFDTNEHFMFFDAGDAFISNHGSGKYLLASRRLDVNRSFWGGAGNRGYNAIEFVIKKSNGNTQLLRPNFYNSSDLGCVFAYLGNGIYQSFIENGIGRTFDALDDGLSINDGAMYRANVGTSNEYFSGIGRDKPGLSTPYQNRLDAHILPENQNVVIYNNEIIVLNGALSIDLAGVFDFDLSTNNGQPSEGAYYNNYLRLLGSIYRKSTVVFGNTSQNLSYSYSFRHPTLFGWRSRQITHEIWLPDGNRTFTFNSNSSFTANTNGGNTYIYNEQMSGEVMVMSWKDKYITHEFNNVSKQSTYNNATDVLTESCTVSSQSLKLKTYNSQDEKILNSSGKFLILNKGFLALDSTNFININLNTTSFRIRIRENIQFYEQTNPNLNLQEYINEPIITSTQINEENYILRGYISNINQQSVSGQTSIFITIVITEKIKTVKVKSSDEYLLYFSDPFAYAIVLDNGCFWNYYLSYLPIVQIEITSTYKRFRVAPVQQQAFGNSIVARTESLGGYKSASINGVNKSLGNDLICDQTTNFLHTNPITVPFCADYKINRYFPPSNLLLVDNLVGNSIFRVNSWLLDNEFINFYNTEELRIQEMPVSEWKILENGDVKYSNSFLVKYENKYPFTDDNGNINAYVLIQMGNSYHPKG